MKTICVLLIALTISYIVTIENSIYADETIPFKNHLDSFIPQNIITYELTEKDADYEESQLRRAEIVFFISMPVSLLITFLGIQAYRGISGRMGSFTSIEYQYLIISTLGISFTIALKDNRVVFWKDRF